MVANVNHRENHIIDKSKFKQVLRFHVSISFEWHNEIEIETSSHQATYEKAIRNI